MRILILTQYFHPEANAPAHRHGFFSKYLGEKGDDVTVICETPNYPKGEVFEGYKNKFFYKEKIGKTKVIRSWVRVTPRKDFLSRILNYASFFCSSFFSGLRIGKVDVVFASSPPLPVIFSGYLLSIFKRAPLITDIRDIWPDSAMEVGMIRSRWIFRILEHMERHIYRKSARIVVNASGLKKRLVRDKGVFEDKIDVLTNGAELDFFRPNIDASEIEKRYDLNDRFVVLYTGLLGLAQNPQIMVEAAKILKDRKDIVFLVAGEGVMKEECERLAGLYGLGNIIFSGERPRNEMPLFCAAADVAVIPYKNSDLFKDVIPSKMFDYMAAGLPMIINLDGEGAQIIKDAGCGLVVGPEDAKDLAGGILKIYADRQRSRMGERGRDYVEKNYDRKEIAERLTKLMRRYKD